MAFEKDTRDLLAKNVAACRRRLMEEVTDPLRGVFDPHPDGPLRPFDKLTRPSPDQSSAVRRLHDLLDHYTNQEEAEWTPADLSWLPEAHRRRLRHPRGTVFRLGQCALES